MLHEFPATSSLNDMTLRSPTFRASLFVLASLATVLVLFALLMPTAKTLPGTCSNEACRQATKYLLDLMDDTVNPCDDFYHHVCNVWLRKQKEKDFAHATLWKSLNIVQIALLEHKGNVESYTDLPGISQFTALFESCLTFLTPSPTLSDANLAKAFVNDVKVLHLSNVKDALQTVIRLSLRRGISTLFQVSLIRQRNENVGLYISQAVSLTAKLNEKAQSSTFARFMAQILNTVTQILPKRWSRDVNDTALRLVEFDMKVTAGDPEFELATLSVLHKHLRELVGGGDFVLVVNSVLPKASNLVGTSKVWCNGLNSIKDALHYFSQQLELGLLYVFVHVLMEIGKFYYAGVLFENKPKYVAQVCLEASRDVMPPNIWSAVLNSLAALDSTNLAERLSVDLMFDHIRRMASGRPLTAGMDEKDHRDVVSALSSMRLLSEIGESYELSNSSGSLHVNFTKVAADFSNSHISLKSFESLRRLSEPPSIEDVVRSMYATMGGCIYSPMLNAVILPSALRRSPFVYSTDDVPIEFDLGTVGVFLARSVFEAGLPSARSDFTWRTQKVAHFVHCHEHQAPPLLHSLFKEIRPSEALDLFAWAWSVKLAHRVMVNKYEGSGNMSTSKFDWQAAQRIFFRRFCLTTCSSADDNGQSANARSRCLVPLLSLNEFYTAFSCPAREVNTLRYCLDTE